MNLPDLNSPSAYTIYIIAIAIFVLLKVSGAINISWLWLIIPAVGLAAVATVLIFVMLSL